MTHWTANEYYRLIMMHNHLNTFFDVWNLKSEWFEEPNNRRAGWSGASRIELKTPDGNHLPVFLKRQQNHNTFSIKNPFAGQPTFRREFNNFLKMQKFGLPVAPLVYYGEARIDGQACAALMTIALDDFKSLDQWWELHPSSEIRRAALTAIASWVATLSKRKWEHGCLYDKHIFIRNSSPNNKFGRDDIRFIDLEKMRRCLTVRRTAEINIEQLLRHLKGCSEEEREFLVVEFNKHMHSPA